jgi:hypothetical protein
LSVRRWFEKIFSEDNGENTYFLKSLYVIFGRFFGFHCVKIFNAEMCQSVGMESWGWRMEVAHTIVCLGKDLYEIENEFICNRIFFDFYTIYSYFVSIDSAGILVRICTTFFICFCFLFFCYVWLWTKIINKW